MRAAALAIVLTLLLHCPGNSARAGEMQTAQRCPDCASHGIIKRCLLAAYGEKPVGMGLFNAQPDAVRQMMQFFASPKGETWTIVAINPSGLSCLRAAGEFWSGMDELPKGDPM